MRKITIVRYLSFTACLSLLLLNEKSFAIRDAPVTTALTISACPSSNALIPVLVTGFTSICSVTLRIDYDPTLATFDTAVGNPALAGMVINSVTISSNLAKIMIAWASVTPISLATTDTLVKLTMNYINGSATLVFNNTAGGGSECEYADENADPMNDIPTSSFYVDGAINSLTVGIADSISGTDTVCAGTNGVTYSVTPVTNATDYLWSLPSGFTIASGSNTNSITVDISPSASSGDITVTPSNVCGSGSASPPFPVTVNPQPMPTIIGPSEACENSTDNIYITETGMTNYTWSVSSGGAITSGAGTNVITVTWNTAGNQWVSVNYINSNGCTASSATSYSVVVDPAPETPVIHANGDTLWSNAVNGNQWYYNGNMIPGATSQSHVAQYSGWYWCVVTLNGCPSDTSNNIYLTITGIEELPGISARIFPIPNNGKFTVSIDTRVPENLTILVYDWLDHKIINPIEINVDKNFEQVINLQQVPSGIYTLMIRNSENRIVRKVIVNK